MGWTDGCARERHRQEAKDVRRRWSYRASKVQGKAMRMPAARRSWSCCDNSSGRMQCKKSLVGQLAARTCSDSSSSSSRNSTRKGLEGNGVRRLGAYEASSVDARVVPVHGLLLNRCAPVAVMHAACTGRITSNALGGVALPDHYHRQARLRIGASMRLGIPGAWDWRKRGQENRKQIHPSSLSGPYLAIGSGSGGYGAGWSWLSLSC